MMKYQINEAAIFIPAIITGVFSCLIPCFFFPPGDDWFFACCLTFPIFVSIGGVFAGCCEINSKKEDWSLSRPSDAYRYIGTGMGGDGLSLEQSESEDRRREIEKAKYEEELAFYNENREYYPIDRMSRFEIVVLLLACAFWPVSVFKEVGVCISGTLKPFKKTFGRIFDEQ